MARSRSVFMAVASVCLVLAAFPSVARAHEGHTTWKGWRFDWEVRDYAGIGIRNVYYNNELVFWKASLPVIRVRYNNNTCGPYADRITWGLLVPISNCGNSKVCQTSFNMGGHQWLELGVYARIGSYHIYQSWYFSDDGQLDVRVWSKGLQCNVSHDHHPYWRMDFDVAGASSDQVFVYDNNRPNQGWGPGWLKHPTETNEVKNSGTNRLWFVRDSPTAHGVWVFPGPDGVAGSFSSKDAASRRYRYSEDEAWPFGASGHLGYSNGEDVAEEDVILWYIAHMPHSASSGANLWHWSGPLLRVHR